MSIVPVTQPPRACKVYTPRKLAHAMIDAIRKPGTQDWLEPSCGRGVFLDVIRRHGDPTDRIVGIDLDPDTSPADAFGSVQREVDFLEWSGKLDRMFDCIVGNPPYVAIKCLQEPLRSIAADVLDYDGSPIGLRANTWYVMWPNWLCGVD